MGDVGQFFVTAGNQLYDAFVGNPIAQAIGLLSLVLSLASFQQKRRSRLMLLQMLASLSCAVSLIMLGGITGGILDLIAFSRTVVFSQRGKHRWADSPLWLVGYIVLIVAVGIITWEQGSIVSLFAILGTVLSTLALYMKEPRLIRLISLLVGPCWIAYNFVYGSAFGILNELIAMTSIIVALVRHDVGKGKRRVKSEE